MRITLFFSIFLTLTIISCTKNTTSNTTVAEQTLVHYYADMLILREEAKLWGIDSSLLNIRMDSLYQVYQMNHDQLQTALQNYKKDLTTWKGFYEKVIQRLDTIQQKELSKPKM